MSADPVPDVLDHPLHQVAEQLKDYRANMPVTTGTSGVVNIDFVPKAWVENVLDCVDAALIAWRRVPQPQMQEHKEDAARVGPSVPRVETTGSTAEQSSGVVTAAERTEQEICICAAVLTKEGITIRGHRHHDAFRAAEFAFCTPQRGEEAQGFITSRNRYVDRREGRRLQEAAGMGSRSGYRGDLLFSEDLY